MPARNHDAVMFDLDGTLLDSLADLANAANHALATSGFPTHPTDAYRRMVGDGVRLLCERAAPGCSPDQIKDLVGLMRAHYAAHGTDLTRPYAGITQLLGDLATRGLVLAVLSNKPDDFTGQLVSHYFGRSTFQVVRGLLPDGALKPDPEAAWAVANEVGISPARWLYLGDTDTDMRTACAAGMTAVGVLWGFRDAAELKKAGAQHLAAAPADVLRLV